MGEPVASALRDLEIPSMRNHEKHVVEEGQSTPRLDESGGIRNEERARTAGVVIHYF